MKRLLLVDGNNLCHRAWHTTGGLSHMGMSTGVAYGVLRDVKAFEELYQPTHTVWAFDYGRGGLRRDIDPEYKQNRRDAAEKRTEEEQEAFLNLVEQINRLQKEILKKVGYRNVWAVRGYEGDDILAQTALGLDDEDEGIIVSTDNDLWQCLQHNVICLNPITKGIMSRESFKKKMGIEPGLWSQVKAMVGDKADNVTGIKGIGPKTAVSWFTGKLKKDSKKYQAIDENLALRNLNYKLVHLPLEGLVLPPLQEDQVTENKRRMVMEELGIRSSRRSVKRDHPRAKGFDL